MEQLLQDVYAFLYSVTVLQSKRYDKTPLNDGQNTPKMTLCTPLVTAKMCQTKTWGPFLALVSNICRTSSLHH